MIIYAVASRCTVADPVRQRVCVFACICDSSSQYVVTISMKFGMAIYIQLQFLMLKQTMSDSE